MTTRLRHLGVFGDLPADHSEDSEPVHSAYFVKLFVLFHLGESVNELQINCALRVEA